MTTASKTAAALPKRISNESVLNAMKTMAASQPDRFQNSQNEPVATAEQIIAFLSEGMQMTAVEGKRLSQPVYRALSELSVLGLLNDSATVRNEQTGALNTLYVVLNTPTNPREKDGTWKNRFLALEKDYQELLVKYQCACESIDRLQEKLMNL
jgi:hypothetical protein